MCGLTLHGLSCLDELGHTRRHMLRVHGQLLLLLWRGLLQHLTTHRHTHTDKKTTRGTSEMNVHHQHKTTTRLYKGSFSQILNMLNVSCDGGNLMATTNHHEAGYFSRNFHVKAALQKKSLQDFEIINPLG